MAHSRRAVAMRAAPAGGRGVDGAPGAPALRGGPRGRVGGGDALVAE